MPANESTPPEGQERNEDRIETPAAMGEVMATPTEVEIVVKSIDEMVSLSVRSTEITVKTFLERSDALELVEEIEEVCKEASE